jgi:UDP-N-acetylglucosamine--N-acetylmuramyl-(pentapeptide) pyrophosphoryl-undecaprenol N-acetylglucosamine transferase
LGNPIRQEILDSSQVSVQRARTTLGFAPDLPLLLVTGGSQGARHLNQVVVQALPELLQFCQILQISGQKLFDETRLQADSIMEDLDDATRQRYRLVPYLSDDMPIALQAAELVICRAGAATLSELAILGKPSILVPLPPALGSSPQEINAATFGNAHAAHVIRNGDLKRKPLIDRVQSIVGSPAQLLAMTNALKTFARPLATQQIVETIVRLAHKTPLAAPEHEGMNV